MLDKLRPRSVYDVMAAIACLAALATGAAYAESTIGSADIIDESIQTQDLKNGQVKRADLDGNSVLGNKIVDGSVADADLAANSVGASEIADDAVDTGAVADFGLSN